MDHKWPPDEDLGQTICAIVLRGCELDYHYVPANHLSYVKKLDADFLDILESLDIFCPLNDPKVVIIE